MLRRFFVAAALSVVSMGAFAAGVCKGLALQQASFRICNAFTIKVPQCATTQAALRPQMTAEKACSAISPE